MPGKSCSVVTCSNSIYKTKAEGKTVIYHRFPRDNELRKQWIYSSGREGLWNPDHGCICSDHFKEDDYERDLKAELLNIPNKKRLKPNIIPTQNLPKQKEILSNNLKIGTRIRKRKVQFASILELTPKQDITKDNKSKKPLILKRKNLPQKRPRLLEINNQNNELIKQEALEIELIDKEQNGDKLEVLNAEHKKTIEDMKLKYEYLLKQNENLLIQNTTLERELKKVEELKKIQEETMTKEKEELIKRNDAIYELLNKKINALKDQDELEKKNKELSEKMSSLKYISNKNKKIISNLEMKMKKTESQEEPFIEQLKQTFTKNQIDILLKKKTKVPWTAEEITQAFTIRYYSKRCYNYLRQKLNYPLPGLTTLKQWSSNPNIKQGILSNAFNSLKEASKNYTESDKLVVLQYNVIKGTSEQDQINDTVARSYGRVQVVQAHGLFSDWNEIIYVDFEKILSTKELYEIIKKFDNIGYNVIAFVGDCGTQKLWHELEITVEKCYFLNPITKEKIYVFVDASHLLKLLRNWFLDTGFTWDNGKIVTQEHIETLLYMNSNEELDNTFTLTSKHVLCKGVQRRIFELVTDLFSRNTVEAIRKYLPDDPHVSQTADFIELVSSWYDIFNSEKNIEGFPLKSNFGLYFEEQTDILEKFYSEIESMRCGSRDTHILFQKAILISINSLLLLQKTCEVKYNKNYIITQKLQLDTLEKLFIKLKSNENQEPNPLDCLERLRIIIMGKIPQPEKVMCNNKNQKIIKQKHKKQTKPKNGYTFSLVDGQYILKENVINDTINEEITENNTIVNSVHTKVDNILSEKEEKSLTVEDKLESEYLEENLNQSDDTQDNEEYQTNEDNFNTEYLEETLDDSIDMQNNEEKTVTMEENEINEEYLSTILQSAGININAMVPGQIVEVVIEDGDNIDYDDSDIIHQVQIVDTIE